MKTLLRFLVVIPLSYLFIKYSPLFIDVNPIGYFIPFGSFEGPLQENYKLSQAERLYTDILKGPESIVFHNGALYTGLEDGRIVRVKDDMIETVAQTGRYCAMPYEEHKCGRPLGMRVGDDGLLYVIDAYYGLFTMDFTTRSLTRLLPSSVLVDGERINFPDDLDIDSEGNIYFTDASKKWDLSKIYYMIVEYENGGRVIRYNINSGETEVLATNMHFPNGIQLSKDKNSLLIAEFLNRRILRYYLKGLKKGQIEVFADNLPAEPDNIRSSPRGYWVAFTSARNHTNYLLLDTLNKYPEIKILWGKIHSAVGTLFMSLAEIIGHPLIKTYAYWFKRGDVVLPLLPRHGIIIEFDEDGNILRSLQSPDGLINGLSEVREYEGYLYLGSFINNYLGRLKL